jgi:hypothetical protein
VQVQELIDESVIDCRWRRPRHELLNDEADLVGIDDGFRWNWPASQTSKPLGKGNGLTSEDSTITCRFPLNNSRLTIRSDELVCSGFAAAEISHVAEGLSCHVRENRSDCVGVYYGFTAHAVSIAFG